MRKKFNTSIHSLIVTVLCLILILSSSISSNAQVNRGNISESIIKYNTGQVHTAPFEFNILAKQNKYAIIGLDTQTIYPYTFNIEKKGTKEPCKSDDSAYLLEIGEEYPFIYTYTEQNQKYIYNGILNIMQLPDGELVTRVYNKSINQVLAKTPTQTKDSYVSLNSVRAAGTMYESEQNDYFKTADVTYDDYDNYGYLSNSDDEDWWKIEFDIEGTANFWLGNIPTGCDYDIALYNEAGALRFNPLDESTNSGSNPELIQYNVEADTIYFIQIRSVGGYSEDDYLFRAKVYSNTDDYENNNTIADAFPISMPTTINATIDSSSDIDYYRIFVEEAGTITIDLTNIPADNNYDLLLYDYSHSVIAYSSEEDDYDEYISIDVTITGAYYICVESLIYASSLQEYELSVGFTPDDAPDDIPANSIGIRVVDTENNPIENAVVYVYEQKNQNTMYPLDSLPTDQNGYVIFTNLTANATYGVNVIANNYAAKSFNTYLIPSDTYNEIELNSRSNITFNDPIPNFSSIYQWTHNGYLSHADNCDEEDFFTRICPHEYMNVEYPQNFGWRYDGDSRLSFHQGVDISKDVTNSTPAYNVFNSVATVVVAREREDTGNTVQLRSNGIYVTYMHLSSINSNLVEGETISAGALIGNVGNTGYYSTGTHLHISFGTSNNLWVDYSGPINDVYTWVSNQIDTFLDPLSYIN